MVTAARASTGGASPAAGSAAGLPAPATFRQSGSGRGQRLYSPPGSGPAKATGRKRNARRKAAQGRAGAAQQAGRRQQITAAAAAPAAAPAPAPAAAAAAPAAAPSPSTGGAAGAYQRRVAGPVRQAWQNRTIGQEGAGAILALFAYPLLVAMLTGGPAKARGWLAAKFVNRPYSGPGSRLAPAPRRRTAPAPPRKGPGPRIRS